MNADEIASLLLRRMGLRIGTQMAQYIAESIPIAPSTPLPVIAGDAATGVAVRRIINPSDLQQQADKP